VRRARQLQVEPAQGHLERFLRGCGALFQLALARRTFRREPGGGLVGSLPRGAKHLPCAERA
jgi:hypothetical protein